MNNNLENNSNEIPQVPASTNTTNEQTQTTQQQVYESNTNPKKKMSNKLIIIGILLIVGIGVSYYFITKKTTDKNIITGGPTLDETLDIGVTVYLNPENLKEKCDAKNSLTSGNSGCLLWYVISYDTTNVNLILGHNSTELVAWNSTGNQIDIPITANAQLDSDTKKWLMPAKLPSADDISMAINGKKYAGEGLINIPRWLTSKLGASKRGNDYWLSIPYDNNSNHGTCGSSVCAYNVSMLGYFSISEISNSEFNGIRPIIAVEKSLFDEK